MSTMTSDLVADEEVYLPFLCNQKLREEIRNGVSDFVFVHLFLKDLRILSAIYNHGPIHESNLVPKAEELIKVSKERASSIHTLIDYSYFFRPDMDDRTFEQYDFALTHNRIKDILPNGIHVLVQGLAFFASALRSGWRRRSQTR